MDSSMDEPTTNPATFDVFMCHNSEDKTEVRKITDELIQKGLKPWLDEREIPPGQAWQPVLEELIETINSAVVFVGESGFGPWQDMELRAFINEFANRKCAVIPAVLPSVKELPKLPLFLKSLNYVDFRDAEQYPLDQLVWGITGEKPDSQSTEQLPIETEVQSDVSDSNLLPNKETQPVEVRLPVDFEDWTEKKQSELLQSLCGLLKISEVKITRAVAGSVRLYLEVSPEDANKIYSANKDGLLSELDIAEARIYPAIMVPPDEEQRKQLTILRDRVKEYWVDGALKHSLHNEVLISLGKRPMDEAVEPPWKNYVALPEQRRNLLLEDRNISTVFDATGLLLILGEPGSGKTTTLLDLAANLIERAAKDVKERVPVILNLSSWKKNEPLAEWMAAELSTKYQVPKKVGMTWLESDYILPLLDGLDEVETSLQPECVTTINEFIEKNKPSGLVVCCRLTEYQWLPDCLNLNGAICLESLNSEEVGDYLVSSGPQLTGLKQAMESDPVLQELSRTPLMLNILCLAYEGAQLADITEDHVDSIKERRNQVFGTYIDRMFDRKQSTSRPYSRDKIIETLVWLAGNMKQRSNSILLVENLQPDNLSESRERKVYELIASVVFGSILSCFFIPPLLVFAVSIDVYVEYFYMLSILCGLVTYRIEKILDLDLSPEDRTEIRKYTNNVVFRLCFGIFFVIASLGYFWISMFNMELSDNSNPLLPIMLLMGLAVLYSIHYTASFAIGALDEISTIESLRWNKEQCFTKIKESHKPLLVTRIALLIIVFLFTLVLTNFNWNSVPDTTEYGEAFAATSIMFALLFLIPAMCCGIVGGFESRMETSTATPNQGIISSRRNAFRLALITFSVFFSSAFILIGSYLVFFTDFQFSVRDLLSLATYIYPIGVGLLGGVVVGLNKGGATVIKHYCLRLAFWMFNYSPLKLVSLLDYCARIIILKKVGGGYVFIHRSVLEYFAELDTKSSVLKNSDKR